MSLSKLHYKHIDLKISPLFLILLMGCMMFLFYSCSSGAKIEIEDYGTNKTVTEFATSERESDAADLTNMISSNEETDDNVGEPDYTVHFIDPKDSKYDIWYFAYVENGNVYFQYDIDRTFQDENFKFTDEIKKCTEMTEERFNEILSAK